MDSGVETGGPEPALSTRPADRAGLARREGLVVGIALVFSWLTFSIIQYDRMRPYNAALEGWIQQKYAGTLSEGDQFRIALPYAAHWLEVHAHIRPVQSLPWMQGVAYGLGLLLLYLQLRWSPRMRSAGRVWRLLATALFLAAVQFPALWIFPWERPETMLAMFYLAAVTLLAVHFRRVGYWVACLAVVALSVVQAMARSDAPVVAGGAIILWAALLLRDRPAAERWRRAVLGALCGCTGAVMQLVLARMFPPRVPGQTNWTFQLIRNFSPHAGPLHLGSFLTALVPLLATLWFLGRRRVPVEAVDKLVLLTCLLHLPIYMAMGLVNEVRIYVPYLFLASTAMAKIWAGYLLGETGDRADGISPG